MVDCCVLELQSLALDRAQNPGLTPKILAFCYHRIPGQTYDRLSHGTSPLSIDLVAQTNREVEEEYPQEVRWPLGVCNVLSESDIRCSTGRRFSVRPFVSPKQGS